ncbi:TetR/AcrR family transcriptional regulator [Egibacter rhizosphaerae]|uniref:TetR/AcrR family transcriptional regulator n=1 Tax=Egibacter rhizosphaerae TaxID=1670831 RepID=A0A411YC82_9ACTN|nr:TetR/AcrR family transcriptional regulator [Egibacter rhizosphaerae]QBI18796.1 TetR/AcrR family transcriptional regulator [Egibacter rhizosphaerae]
MADAASEPRRNGRSTDTHQRIHEVALDLFLQRGFSHTTLQDIADELGLTRAALYYHYRSKDDLIASLIQPAKDAVDAFLDHAQRTDPPARELLEGFFDLNYRHRRIFLALVRDPTGLGSVDAEGWVTELAATAQRLLAGDDPTPDGRIRAVVAINGLSRCATVLPDIPHDELRRRSVDLGLQILEDQR